MITDNQNYNKSCDIHLHWTALFAGAIVGVGLGFLINVLSMAIGISAYMPSANGSPVIAIGGILGLIIGVIITMGVAGFVAGCLGKGCHSHCHGGVIYGFLTWSITLILTALLISPISHYVSFYERSVDPVLTHAEMAPVKAKANKNTATNPPTNSSVATSAFETGSGIPAVLPPINPQHLVWNNWILFVLFLIGAIVSCIGACYGMCCKKNKMECDTPKQQKVKE